MNTSIPLTCNTAFVWTKGHNAEHGSNMKSRAHRKIINITSQIKGLKTSASNKVILWCENNTYFIYLEKENI